MKISSWRTRVISIRMRKPFRVSFGTIVDFPALLLRVEADDGSFGIGEASPLPPVTCETIETVQPVIRRLMEAIAGRDPRDLAGIHAAMSAVIGGNTSAKAAVDIALHDLLARRADLPLYRYLGGTESRVETDASIGIAPLPEMCAEAARRVREGFRCLKLKVGRGIDEDLATIAGIRQAVGPGVAVRVDANQGWRREEAAAHIRRLGAYGIQLVEQPVAARDCTGLAAVRREAGTPIMADESLFSAEDARVLIELQAIDYFNLKLMKCGGIHPASAICALAEAASVPCMIGCMLESPVGIAAAASLAAARKNIVFADLDSPLHIHDVDGVGGLRIDGGTIILGDAPGLGIDADV